MTRLMSFGLLLGRIGWLFFLFWLTRDLLNWPAFIADNSLPLSVILFGFALIFKMSYLIIIKDKKELIGYFFSLLVIFALLFAGLSNRIQL